MAESRRLRTQADEHGNRPDDCGHCTLLPTVNGDVRAVQVTCPEHSGHPNARRLRTQAERDTERWRAIHQLAVPKPPPDKTWLQTEPAPRRRWWHRYTRRNP